MFVIINNEYSIAFQDVSKTEMQKIEKKKGKKRKKTWLYSTECTMADFLK